MSSNYNHLNEDTQRALKLNVNDRIGFLENPILIEHPKLKEIHSYLTQIMNRPKRPRMQNVLITGESNMGKTTIIESFKKKHTSFTLENEDGMTITIKPVILALASENADIKHLYISVLESFWTPFNPSDSLTKLRHQMYFLLEECNVKMLIIDEVHHFLGGSAKQQRNIMNAIKNIGNKLMIPIVCVGLPESEIILTSDSQLSSRFDHIKLNKWELNLNFRGLLNAFEKRLPLKEASNLDEEEIATLLHIISNGNVGDLHKLLIECCSYAIEKKKEKITIDIIKKFKWIKPTNSMTLRQVPI